MNLSLDTSTLNPSKEMLRKFGLTSAAIVAVLFGLLFPWLFGSAIPLWPFILAGVLGVWALVHPASLLYVYRPWMKIGAVLGWVNSRILLSFVFYIIITPVGLIRRLLGKTSIRSLEPEGKTYRIVCPETDKKQMENPY